MGEFNFQNWTLLHMSSQAGDVRIMEVMLSLGFAIDCPAGSNFDPKHPRESLPPSCIALLLCCIGLLCDVDVHKLEYLTQLIRLGANCNVKLDIAEDYVLGEKTVMWRNMGLGGKNAKEIAGMFGYTNLVKLMEQYSNASTERKWSLVHCRCGSRQPWKDCYLGSLPFETLTTKVPFCKDDAIASTELPAVYFRVSPHAPCPCGTSSKSYFECCWHSSVPAYLNDATGVPFAPPHKGLDGNWMGLPSAPESRRLSKQELIAAFRERARLDPDSFLFQDSEYGLLSRDMDMDVYLGTLERTDSDSCFFWRVDHWAIGPEGELLCRAEDWNEALARYCDDKELVGSIRESVIRRHTASLLAPCGHPMCRNMAQRSSVSPLRAVGYCSRLCHKAHWKLSHKAACIKR